MYPADEATPTWYGLEVEVSTSKDKLGKFMHKHHGSVYLKEDSSIRGSGHNVEIVSHPHSFKGLMDSKSWLSEIGSVPTQETDDNGCHVHISRTAFKDDKHYSLFYFLLHRMHQVATKVGGRELTTYCELNPTGRVHSKTKEHCRNGGRSVYLNERNEDTVEARFFKGTTKVSKLRAYVQLLESLIKYTKYHAKTVTVKGWFGYVTQKSTKYKELLEVLGDIDKEHLDINVVYKEPRKKAYTIDTIKAKDLVNVFNITTSKNGDVLEGEIEEYSLKQRVIYFRLSNGDSKRLKFDWISKLEVEEEE